MTNGPPRRRAIRGVGALLAATLVAAAPAAAQEAGAVTLVFDNGLDGENLSGRLEDYDGARFLLDSPIGTVAIPAEGVSCIGAACPEGTRLAIETPVLVLTSHDGRSSVTGNLMAFEAGTYVLATEAGEIRVPADLVRCEGAACAPAPVGGPATLIGKGAPIEGILLAVEKGSYVMDVAGFGTLRVSTETHTCVGGGCP